MKYKCYSEDGEIEWTCEAFDLEDAAQDFYEYMYWECEGWEWMHERGGMSGKIAETVTIVDEDDKEFKFQGYIESVPQFYVHSA